MRIWLCLCLSYTHAQGYSRCNEYIATQGPLPNTVGDFWRLLWDKKASTIVMLTNLVEKMKVGGLRNVIIPKAHLVVLMHVCLI